MKIGLFDAIRDLNKVKKDKENLKKQKLLQKESANRIDDLFIRMHTVGNVTLEIPNLFAQVQMERYFSGMENIDLNKAEHVAACVYFFRNQKDVKIAEKSIKGLEMEVQKIMTEIRMEQISEYVYCIHEIFVAIKKKSLRSQTQLLEYLKNLLEKESPHAGAMSLSH